MIKPDRQPDISTKNISGLYADLSHYYDSFCADVDYAEQCAFVDRLFRALGESSGHELMDLACGTGRHLELMAEKGYAPAGLDNSSAMLAAARLRCPAADLVLGDIASFDFTQRFDLMTCFLYSIHYSHPISSLQQTLLRAFQALCPGGLFVFDLADCAGVARRDALSRAQLDGAQFEFRSGWRYCGEGEGLDLLVSIKRLEDTRSGITAAQWHDRHIMTAISAAEVQRLMQDIGFEVFMFERDFSAMQTWAGESYNVIFAGRRSLS